MITATDYFFTNTFRASEQEVNKLGENFDVSTVFHALINVNKENDKFLNSNFNRFERARIDIFLYKAGDILADADIDMEELDIEAIWANCDIFISGFESLDQELIDAVKEVADKADIILTK